MIPLLIDWLRDLIDRSVILGPLGVFQWVEFRAVLSIVLSFFIVVVMGKRTILWLVKLKIRDKPEFYNKDLNLLMKRKANTPTMGGILVSGAILISTLLLADLSSFYVIMALICLLVMFAIGCGDDWLKLTYTPNQPRAREGLYAWEKLVFQLGLAVVLGIFVHHYGLNKGGEDPVLLEMSHSLTLPGLKTWVWMDDQWIPSPNLIVLSTWPFAIVTIIVISGTSNAVNFTDGMDGLASGVTVIVAFAFMVLAIIAGYHNEQTGFVLAKFLLVPHIPLSDELAIVAGAMVGACLGFLWFNCSPAQVFLGDSGSLPLGGLIGYIAVVIRQEFLLLVIGAIFFAELLSVIIQVLYFKISRGRRIFKCAPIHHHFHLSGWTEQQVVVRFWLLTALLAAVAMATIKIR